MQATQRWHRRQKQHDAREARAAGKLWEQERRVLAKERARVEREAPEHEAANKRRRAEAEARAQQEAQRDAEAAARHAEAVAARRDAMAERAKRHAEEAEAQHRRTMRRLCDTASLGGGWADNLERWRRVDEQARSQASLLVTEARRKALAERAERMSREARGRRDQHVLAARMTYGFGVRAAPPETVTSKSTAPKRWRDPIGRDESIHSAAKARRSLSDQLS